MTVVMLPTCQVTYGRRTHEPFMTGIEGAKCELLWGHVGKHRTRIMNKDFTGTEPFEFQVATDDPE